MKKYNYSITPNIRDFVIRNTKLDLTPNKGIIGYNHIINEGASKRSISSDVAFYLLISDLNSLCIKLLDCLEVELSESKLCALISNFHRKHIKPTLNNLSILNQGNYNLYGEYVFLNTLNPCQHELRDHKHIMALEYLLWGDDSGIYLNSRIS